MSQSQYSVAGLHPRSKGSGALRKAASPEAQANRAYTSGLEHKGGNSFAHNGRLNSEVLWHAIARDA